MLRYSLSIAKIRSKTTIPCKNVVTYTKNQNLHSLLSTKVKKNTTCHWQVALFAKRKIILNDVQYLKTSKSFSISSSNLKKSQKTTRIILKDTFPFLTNLYQLCLVTCSAIILKYTAFREFTIKTPV